MAEKRVGHSGWDLLRSHLGTIGGLFWGILSLLSSLFSLLSSLFSLLSSLLSSLFALRSSLFSLLSALCSLLLVVVVFSLPPSLLWLRVNRSAES